MKMDVSECSEEVIKNYFYNWDCQMAKAFNGTKLPSDFPRDVQGVTSLKKEGRLLAFYQLKNYCKDNNLVVNQ